MDEAKAKDSFLNDEDIKNFITAKHMPVETKGIDGQVRVSSFVRLIFFSNNRIPIKIPYGDRRFQVNKCSEEKKNNKEYFDNLAECLNDDVVIFNFYKFLMSIDLSNWSPWNDRPITEAYKDIQSVNVPVIAKWLNEKYMAFMYKYKNKEKKIVRKRATVFYKEFKNYRENIGWVGNVSITTFGLDLKEYIGNGIEKKRISGRYVYFIDYEKIGEYLNKKGYVEDIEEVEETEEIEEIEENSDSDEDY